MQGITAQDLKSVRLVVVGLATENATHFSSISVQTIVRNNSDDLIFDRLEQRYCILKSYSDLLELDVSLRSQGYKGESLLKKDIFCSNAPIKVDQRKIFLETYFKSILASTLKDLSHFVHFLNTSKEKVNSSSSIIKEGYLSKKRCWLAEWKAYYFVLQGTTFLYYEQRNGNFKGKIELQDALIGHQSTSDYYKTDYRHAVMINEINEGRMSNHSLCAHDDIQRDAWLKALSDVSQLLPSTPMSRCQLLKRLNKKEDYTYMS